MQNRFLCRGKDKDDKNWYEGYYVLLHDTTYCCMPSDNVSETERLNKENTHHFIIFERMTDWGLPNKHLRAEVLPETLCQCMPMENIKIWENHIYRWTDQAYLCDCTGIVRYGEYLQDGSSDEYPRIPCCGFYMEIVKIVPRPDAAFDAEDYPDYLRKTSVQEVFGKNENVKCIGNIFDNPELVECEEV